MYWLRTDGAYLEGDGDTNRVFMISFPPVGVNLHALLYQDMKLSMFILTEATCLIPSKVGDDLSKPCLIAENYAIPFRMLLHM